MCLEDLRLARGYQYGQTVSIGSGVPQLVLPADARRVGLIISSFLPVNPDMIAIGSTIDPTSSFASFLSTYSPFVLRIGDYGQLLTGPIYQTGISGSGDTWYFAPIFTNVSALPIYNLDDMKRANPQGVQ